MKLFLYIEINIICILLLSWIYISFIKNYDKQMFHILFRNVLLSDIFIMVVDIASQFVNGNIGSYNYYAHYVVSVFFISLTIIVSLLWYFFLQRVSSEIEGIKKTKRNKYLVFLQSLPAIVFVFFVVITPWTKNVFYIDKASGILYCSSGYIFQKLITYAYFTIGSTYILIGLIKRRKYSWVSTHTSVALIIMPFLSGMSTLFFSSAPLAWPTISVLLNFVFFDMQIAHVSTDGLTGLNNRRLFNKYIESAVSEKRTDKFLFLFMIDIDKFKLINDKFGHQEGDNALIGVSEILKSVSKDRDCFITRYGGDEFAILLRTSKKDDVQAIKKIIQDKIEVFSKVNNLEYNLSLCIGVSKCDDSCYGNPSLLIQKADVELYQSKQQNG